MVGPGMFDGLITALLLIGAVIGLVGAGLIWLLVYLYQHIDIRWIP